MSEKGPDDGIDFAIALVCTIGIVIAMGCMLYLFVTAP